MRVLTDLLINVCFHIYSCKIKFNLTYLLRKHVENAYFLASERNIYTIGKDNTSPLQSKGTLGTLGFSYREKLGSLNKGLEKAKDPERQLNGIEVEWIVEYKQDYIRLHLHRIIIHGLTFRNILNKI